jgi:Xaa-Pro aminopeptidase
VSAEQMVNACGPPTTPRTRDAAALKSISLPGTGMRLRSAVLLIGVALCGQISIVAAQAPPASMDFRAHRQRVLEPLGPRLLLVPSQQAYKGDDQAGFKQATDFQYLTGISDVIGAVLAIDGSARRSVLFAPAKPPALTRPWPRDSDATRLGIDSVLPIDSLEAWLRRHLDHPGILIAPNDPRGAVRGPVPMAGTVTRWGAWLASLGYLGAVSSATPVLRPLREVKDANEIAILAQVGTLSGQAMLAGMRALRPGQRQRIAEAAVVNTCIRGGGVHSFWPWAMSGPHGVYTDLWNSFVDYDNHDRVMRAGELVRVDVGCALQQYMGDVGRTAPVSGRFTPGQREAWDLFIAAYKSGLPLVRDGARVSDIFDAARATIRARRSSLVTPLGQSAAAELLSPRGIEAWQFHGVGLDDAEGAPVVLRAGMVVAYEIMFAVGGEHFYLEDMLVVESSGYRNLTAGLPYTAAEIEGAMQGR